jgi:hypothetical protein
LKALRKLHEKNTRYNLGGEKAEVFLSLTEQTFLAIITLNDLTISLRIAQSILSKAKDSELVERFKEDIDDFKLLDQLWRLACQI